MSKVGSFRRAARTLMGVALLAGSLSVAAPAVIASEPSGAAHTTAVGCTAGYSPCIKSKTSDVDCYGGSGNGPRYTKAGVVYRVTGRDRYGLDADHDGWGCER